MTSSTYPQEKLLNAICAIAAQGEAQRGSDGVVLFDRKQETASWMKLAEIPSAQLRETTSDILSEEGGQVYVVVEEDTDERQVHIWKLPRYEVASRIHQS